MRLFLDSPGDYWDLLLSNGEYKSSYNAYAMRLYWFDAPKEMILVKIVSIGSILTFHTYTAIALLFACFSFAGSWALYSVLLRIFPTLYTLFAWMVFFIPSVFFWGSGILKDSIGLGALGFIFFGVEELFVQKRIRFWTVLSLIVSAYLLYFIRLYLLLAFLPPLIFWVFHENSEQVKNALLRWVAKPIFFAISLFVAFYSTSITENDTRYNLESIGKYTKINSEYLYTLSKAQDGSAYSLGEIDGTFAGMVRLAPAAIGVSLYRPFIWETRNPVMLLSAIESLAMLLFTLYVFYKVGVLNTFRYIFTHPLLLFFVVFIILFSVGVGLNSYNFGTLVRYRIPILPFYGSFLVIILAYHKLKKEMANDANR